jgi:hypothetical protein
MSEYQERIPVSERDPSLPDFRYPEEERVEMKKVMTEQEIDEKEALVRSHQNHEKLERERNGK